MQAVCVYCSSSNIVDSSYFDVTYALGKRLAERKLTLVFGGANVGLMGHLAKAVQENGGKVISVIPKLMDGTPYVFEPSDEVIVTADLRERKAKMDERADAFISLPGGYGTMDESMEILALKQLHTHKKPIVFLNHNNFWAHLQAFLQHLFDEKFASEEHHASLAYFADDLADAFRYLDTYEEPNFPIRWF